MIDTRNQQGTQYYRIVVKGMLDRKWADWFNGLAIQSLANEQTLLSGWVADQAALHGMLAKVRDLGLTLLLVQMVEKEDQN